MAKILALANPVKGATHLRLYEARGDIWDPASTLHITGQLGSVQQRDDADPQGIDLGDGTEFLAEPGLMPYQDTMLVSDVSTAAGNVKPRDMEDRARQRVAGKFRRSARSGRRP